MKYNGQMAQAGILVSVLIVLVVIGLIVVFWNFIYPLISEKSKETKIDSLLTELEIKEAVIFVTGASKVTVSAGKDVDDLSELKLVFQGEKSSHVESVQDVPKELESKTYSFDPVLGIGKIKKISVVPVFGENLGREFNSDKIKFFEIPAGLISWWRFDEDNGKDFADGNNGELKNSAKIENKALVLDGNGYMDVGNNFSISDKLSISAWINPAENKGKIIERGDANKNFEISITSEKKINFSYFSNGDIFSSYSDDALEDGWNHVLASVDWGGDKNTRIYANNVLSLKSSIQEMDLSSEEIFIGRDFSGEIDEVMIFNSSLSSEQAQGIFEQTRKE